MNYGQRPDMGHVPEGVIYRLLLVIIEAAFHVQSKDADQVNKIFQNALVKLQFGLIQVDGAE